MKSLWLGMALCLGSACAPRPALKVSWADKSRLQYTAQPGDEDFDAIVLFRRDARLFTLRTSEEWYSQRQWHEVFYIRTEAGERYADVKVQLQKKERLVQLTGRIFRPDGSMEEIPRSRIIEQKSDDKSGASENVHVTVFRFPDVRKGSVLEVNLLAERPNYFSQMELVVDTDLPVRRYEFELLADEHARFALKAYNTTQPIQQSREGAFWKLRWSADNLKGTTGMTFRPHPTWFNPWWSFRVTGFQWSSWYVPIWKTWADVLESWGEQAFLESKTFAGYKPLPLSPSCPEVTCKVEAATRAVAAATDFDGFEDFDDARPLQEVVDGRMASSAEKAILLRKVLADAGVEAWLGGLTRPFTAVWDPDFPSAYRLNHAVVYVPPQGTLQKATWVDPSCEHCRPGELPYWSQGADAVLFRVTAPLGKTIPEAKLAKVEGTLVPLVAMVRTYDVTLEPGGDAQVRMTLEQTGARTQWWIRRRRTQTAKEEEEGLHEGLTERLSGARLTSHERARCDEAAARCEQSVQWVAPELATRTEQRWIVPAGKLFKQDWKGVFLQAERPLPMVHEDPDSFVETVKVRVPPGMQPVELPPAFDVSAPGLRATLAAERKDGEVWVRRTLSSQLGHYPAETYGARQAVVQRFVEARNATVVFGKGLKLAPAAMNTP